MTGAVRDGVMGRGRDWLGRKASAVVAKLHEHWGRLCATRAARLVIGAGRWIYDGLLPRGPNLPNDPEMAFAGTHGLFASGRVILLLFFAGLLGWGALAPLDSAILASGVIVVESHRKSIQHLEGGIVQDIPVKDGQDVKAGQLLMRLDDTQARASLDLLKGQDDALAAQEARLLAERDGGGTIVFPDGLTRRGSDPKVAEAMRGEESTFQTRRLTMAKQVEILNQRSQENESAIAGLRSQQSALARQIALLDREVTSVQTLYDKGLSTLPRLLALQRQAAEADGQRGQVGEKIAEMKLTSGENQLQIMNLRNQQLSDIVKDLRDVQTRRFDLLDRIGAAGDVLARLAITAPVSGKIVGLSVHSRGAVVKPGETVMEIVPRKDALEVEAHVRPEDADGVQVGMTARVNFSAYQQRRLPVIQGIVNNISADRLVDQRTGQAYFAAEVTVDRSTLKDYPNARILPGLPVEVSINTGSRTAL
ncbi:MAG TPA: HlyD family type I secretion periplasmic adaptor subunit, partial [Rhizomicrobium sp.]|nr:HlyD family type I secretion periplasmic adaptor subunit [Rhizomicrobium sp.]